MSAEPVPGAQAVERASLVFLAIAEDGVGGTRARDVAKACDLPLSTTHRLIAALTRAGLVDRRADGTLAVSQRVRRAVA